MASDQDLDLTADEEVVDQTVVRVWRLSRLWWMIFLFPLAFALPFVESIPVLFVFVNIFLLWLATYLVRERWRLTLTNRQIVARKLYPRPFTLLSRIYYFPLSKVEGLSVGPRAFRTILLLGVYIATNIGVTLLKSGLSARDELTSQYDLPDTIDALILILKGITFLPFLSDFADWIESSFSAGFRIIDQTVNEALIIFGIAFIILGVVTVLLSIPRRYHLQIRVRHGADFRLEAGIPRPFWQNCYKYLYKEEVVDPPEEYKKWRFPWLKDEKPQTSADLEEVIYINRFISIFAIYAGTARILNRVRAGTLGEDVVLWIIVAASDIFIAIAAVVFSKKKNEMVVTDRRIIFAQEMRDISGAFGRRLYLMSDMGRDDVAGFKISRIRGISYRYLILTVLTTLVTVIFWQDLVVGNDLSATIFTRGVFIFLILIFANFVLQTYLEFNVKTKGGEIWHMRHQLSNPLTMMRQLIGNDENRLLTTLLSNRLEEKEVVDTIQIIRAGDLGLKPKLFGDSKYYGEVYDTVTKERRYVELEDLLLQKEQVKFETNVSRGVPRRKLNLFLATIVLLLASSSLYTLIGMSSSLPGLSTSLIPFYITMPIIFTVILIPALWIRYYSLYRARILFSEKRAFFIDSKKPPLFLYLMGIHEESIIEETLQDQIHSTYTTRQFNQQQYWRDLVYHSFRFIFGSIIFGISTALIVTIYGQQNPVLIEYPILYSFFPLLLFFFYIGGIMMTWHAGNAYIAFVRSIPRRVVHTHGIGSHFIVPFSTKAKADQIAQTVWEGIITE